MVFLHISIFYHKKIKLFVNVIFLLVPLTSYATDLLQSELDQLINKVPNPDMLVHSELIANSQTHLQNMSLMNQINITQLGTNNISNVSILGTKNYIHTKQVGSGNLINVSQKSNGTHTEVEQFGDHNQVLINIDGNNQINRITQIGSHMTAIIKNAYAIK